MSHTYAVKSPLVTITRPIFAPKSTPSRGPIPKPHYLPHSRTRPTHDAKRQPDPIRRFSSMYCTDRRTDRPTDRLTDRPRKSLIVIGRCATSATRPNNTYGLTLVPIDREESRWSGVLQSSLLWPVLLLTGQRPVRTWFLTSKHRMIKLGTDAMAVASVRTPGCTCWEQWGTDGWVWKLYFYAILTSIWSAVQCTTTCKAHILLCLIDVN